MSQSTTQHQLTAELISLGLKLCDLVPNGDIDPDGPVSRFRTKANQLHTLMSEARTDDGIWAARTAEGHVVLFDVSALGPGPIDRSTALSFASEIYRETRFVTCWKL